MMTIAAYIRVSSKSQKTDSQRSQINAWLKSNGYDPDDILWFEDFETGTTMARKGFVALCDAVNSGDVHTVVIWKLDRLARSTLQGLQILSHWCEDEIRVVSVTQQIDLSGKVGHLVAGVLFGIAEIEHQHIKERQAAGIAEAKKKGIYKGRRRGTTKANPERAKELKAQGFKPSEIMKALGIKSRATLAKYLAN